MLINPPARRSGFTLVEIMIVVAIIAVLASIAVPSFMRARKRSQATILLNTLRLIDGAKDQYCVEYNKAAITPTCQDLIPYAKAGTTLNDALALAVKQGGATESTFWAPNFYHVVDYQINDSGVEPSITGVTVFSDVCDSSFWSPFGNDAAGSTQ